MGYLEKMTVSPCLDMATLSIGAYLWYDMNGRFQMLGGKNWILPKEMNANRFFWASHWLEIWSNHLFPSMGPNGGIVAMDSVVNCDNPATLFQLQGGSVRQRWFRISSAKSSLGLPPPTEPYPHTANISLFHINLFQFIILQLSTTESKHSQVLINEVDEAALCIGNFLTIFQ